MSYELKPDTGSLFKNDRKTTDQHPGATGSALIGGVAYFVDAWTNTKPDGSKYQALKFKRKDKQPFDAGPAPDDADSPPF